MQQQRAGERASVLGQKRAPVIVLDLPLRLRLLVLVPLLLRLLLRLPLEPLPARPRRGSTPACGLFLPAAAPAAAP